MADEESSPDVDARFLLANERTLLAWVRTGLTLMAAGVAAHQLGAAPTRHRFVSGALVVVGTLSVLAGGRRYLAADRALREGSLPRSGRFPLVLVAAVAVVGAAFTVAVLVG